MQIRVITTTDEFFKLKEPWERLQHQDKDVTYYSTFEYNWTWWDVYKSDKNKELFIVVAENNGKVVGIAPLIIEKINKKIFSYRCIKFLGRGDYMGLLLDNSPIVKYRTVTTEIFNFIESKYECYERINLTHIKANSKLSAFMLKSKKHNKNFNYLIECPILRLNRFESFQAYKKEFVSSNAQQYSNKLRREVGYNFKIICNENEDVYERISKIHINEQYYLVKTKGRKERSSLYKNKFYSEFVKRIYHNNANVITFTIEDDNGTILAYETCYLYKRVLHMWNTAYNTKYEKYNLGKIINLEVAKYLFKNNMADIFDFGAGRYFWKFEWTDDFMLDYKIDIWNEKNFKSKLLKKLYEIIKKIKYFGRKNG
jgi:CelD/BcsL family acetyltransferase involved in cellulose biosynthesis